MTIRYSKQAKKYLEKMPKAQRLMVEAAIAKIPQGQIEPLKGYKKSLRLRVNSYRVIFTYNSDIINIELILGRGDVYNSGY